MPNRDDPKPASYRPYVAARYPGKGRPDNAPVWRVVIHHKLVSEWNRILDVCGESNAAELWEHLTTQPNRPPKLGTVTLMKGGHKAATADGMSRVHHYEISGGGRIDYRFNANYVADQGDEHPVVQIISVDLGSH